MFCAKTQVADLCSRSQQGIKGKGPSMAFVTCFNISCLANWRRRIKICVQFFNTKIKKGAKCNKWQIQEK